MQRLHVLFISYEFPPEMPTGGIGSYVKHMVHLLYSSGHAVTVFSATINHNKVIRVEREQCINYLIPATDHQMFREKALLLFREFIQLNKVDIIESPEVGACALEIKKEYPYIPLVVKLHTPGVLITKTNQIFTPLHQKLRYVIGSLIRLKMDLGYWSRYDLYRKSDPEYQICLLSDQLVSPSFALKRWVARFWQLDELNIKVIPNPYTADDELYAYSVERQTKNICFIGKLTELKGMYTLTAAIKKILQQHKDYKFILAGRDEWISDKVPSMKNWMISQLGTIADRVIFRGTLNSDEVKELLVQSEICVVPSLWENYPTVVLEAMAAGCAVAASNRGGIPEIITDHENGILFDPMKPASIFLAVEELIQDETLRFRLAAMGRKKVQEENTAKQLTEKILSVYQSVIKQSKKQAQLA